MGWHPVLAASIPALAPDATTTQVQAALDALDARITALDAPTLYGTSSVDTTAAVALALANDPPIVGRALVIARGVVDYTGDPGLAAGAMVTVQAGTSSLECRSAQVPASAVAAAGDPPGQRVELYASHVVDIDEGGGVWGQVTSTDADAGSTDRTVFVEVWAFRIGATP